MVNEKADDRIVHLNGLREADRLPDQAFDPRAQCQMFTLQFLGKAFADLMLGWVQMAAVGAPAIGEEAPDAEGLQQRFQLQERLVLSPPEDVGEDSPGSMVQGLPQPAWRGLLAPKRPHLVGFSLLDTGQKDWASRVRQAVEKRPIDRLKLSLLIQFADHCVLADAQHAGRIPNAAAIQGHVHDLPFHPRQLSLITVLEQ